MRRDFQIAILLGFAAIPAGVALMAAPYYAEALLKAYAPQFVWGGLLVTMLLLSSAIIIAIRGEATEPKLGHARRMIVLGGMMICGVGFLIVASVYFWPKAAVPPTLKWTPDLRPGA